jgi:hypothetical protein
MISPPVPVSRRMERGILALFVAAAAVIALALALPGIREVVAIAQDRSTLTLLTEQPLPTRTVPGAAVLESATFDSARVVATGLDAGTRWLLGAGAGFAALTTALVVGSLWLFVLLLMWRRPFHRALVVATLTAGSALLIGGLLSTGLGGLGRMMAADALNPAAGDALLIGFAFDPAPLLAGVGVLALSFVFAAGQRLQRDTEGLV